MVDASEQAQLMVQNANGNVVALNNLTTSSKAAALGMKALSIAGNMLIGIAVSKGIELIFKGIDNIAHSAEHCKERVDELLSSYKSAIDTANSNAKTIEDLADKYEKLSEGVNNLGENVGLSTAQYAEYNKIVNQIADMFRAMVKGYTNEGNAILSLKGNVEQLRDAYKEAQQEAYHMLIASCEGSDGNDIIKHYQNTISNDSFIKVNPAAQEYIEIFNSLYDAMLSSYEEYGKLYRKIMDSDEIMDQYKMSMASYKKVKDQLKDIGFKSELSDEEKRDIHNSIKSYIQTYQSEIDSALKNVQTLANAYLMTNEDYAGLDEKSKNAASIVVNSINESIANGFKDKVDVGEYVGKIIGTLKDNPEVRDELIGLFELDLSDLQPDSAQEIIDQYIKAIANKIEENPLELKIRLGFDDIDHLAQNYRTAMRKAADKFTEKTPSAKESRALYNTELDAITKFAEENSINTQDEIAFWNQCIEESETREEAMEKYLGKTGIESKPFTNFSEDQTSAIKSYSDALSSISGIYKDIQDADITSVMSTFSDYDWSNFLSGTESLDE